MLPLLTERLGGAPRVADSPHLASALCQGGARLLVYEHGGREWLSLCGELRGLAGPDLVVIAALPPEHAADVAEISGSASAVVAWRGDARPVLEAASRVIAAREAPPAPVRRTGPVLTPQPSPALTPQPVRPAPTPAAPRPRPVMASGTRPSPALTPQPAPALTPRPAPAPCAHPAAGAPVAHPHGGAGLRRDLRRGLPGGGDRGAHRTRRRRAHPLHPALRRGLAGLAALR